MKYVTAEISISFLGDTSALYPFLHNFADQVIDNDGDMAIIAQQLPLLCHALLDHSMLFHGVSNCGDVWNSEESASAALSKLYEEESAKYAVIDQVPETQVKSDWLVVSLSFCYERGRTPAEAIECEIKSVEGTVDAFKQLSSISSTTDSLRAFNLHWSPSTVDDNLSDDQIIEYYPNLITL